MSTNIYSSFIHNTKKLETTTLATWLSWLEQCPDSKRLEVPSPLRTHTGGSRVMFLSHINVCFFLSLSLSLSLSLKSVNISTGEDFK